MRQGEIRAEAPSRLWTFLSRVIRPDPESLFPSMLRLGPGDILLAVLWLVLAVALIGIGIASLPNTPAPYLREGSFVPES